MTRLLGALVTALLALCGLVQPVQTAVSTPRAAVTAYAYDGHDTSARVFSDASERGPPPAYDRFADHNAVDLVSRGVSARPDSRPTYEYTAHDAVVRPAHIDSTGVVTQAAVQSAWGGIASLSGGRVAAKTGSSALDAPSPAVRSSVDDAIERAAAGKVRFPGPDGKVYNNSDDLLPRGGNYTEWTAAQAGAKRGADRIIIEGDPASPNAIYYWDHVNPPVRIGP